MLRVTFFCPGQPNKERPIRHGVVRAVLGAALALSVASCAGHSSRTEDARSALNQGSPWAAIEALNDELDVEGADKQPDELDEDDSLLLLDRAMILQQVGRYDFSSADLQLADKNIELLDFSRGALDDLGKYLFSDDSGPYQAPAYEKVMINTANMINYLSQGNFNGARIEARRLATMQRFLRDQNEDLVAPLGLGNLVAGLVFEASKRSSEANNFYEDSARSARSEGWAQAIEELNHDQTCSAQDCGTLVVFVSVGRVPAKEAKRIPIGLALTYASSFLSPADSQKAAYLAGQGLVTWVNYPALGKPRALGPEPSVVTTSGRLNLFEAANLNVLADHAWDSVKGAIIASAITRLITRVVAGETSRRAVGGVAGALISLGGQAALTAADTPDTRSWSTLPGKVYVGRITLPAGKHTVQFYGQGLSERKTITIPKNGLRFLNFSALR